MVALLAIGCGGGGGGSATTHAISGTVSGPGAAGATVALSGAATASAQTDEAGRYSFGGLADGDYTVAASHTGYTLTPASRSVALAGADVAGQDFVSAVVGPAISGTISGVDAAGVTVTLSGSAASTATTTTGSDGTYRFEGFPDGDYTLTPSKAGDVFSPASRGVTLAGADVSGIDFSVAPAGTTVTVDRVEVAAASVTIGGPIVEYTATLTNWTASGLGDVALQTSIEQGQTRRRASWVAVGTPCAPSGLQGILLPGTCSFSTTFGATNSTPGSGTLVPGSATLAVELVQGAGATLLHSLRVPITLLPARGISGRISGSTAVGLSFVDTSGRTWGLFTGSSDTYAASGFPPGIYTVTPRRSGYKFSPASRTVDVSAADATGIDFSAAMASAVFTLDRLEPDSTTAVIGGPAIPYTAILTNWSASTLSVSIQTWVEQNSTRRASGERTLSQSPGTTTGAYSYLAINAGAGTGTLVPGSAELVVEVTAAGNTTLEYRYPITLQ
jgi:hypothetical protein